MAADDDREVFAVPGPIDLETSRGCHHLLREGAHLVEAAADVERVLGRPAPPGRATADPAQPAPGSAARWIFDRLDLEGTSRDALRARWPGGEAAWSEGLLALELAGLIRRLPAGRLARTIWR
jgi:DNA processing protein